MPFVYSLVDAPAFDSGESTTQTKTEKLTQTQVVSQMTPAAWMRLSHARGASVTVPFKERALAECLSVSPVLSFPSVSSAEGTQSSSSSSLLGLGGGASDAARLIGAVNTLVRCDSDDNDSASGQPRWWGDNTDWIGIQRAVAPALTRRRRDMMAQQHQHQQHRKSSKRGVVLILGAGGTARAAMYAAAALGYGRRSRSANENRRTVPCTLQETAAASDTVAGSDSGHGDDDDIDSPRILLWNRHYARAHELATATEIGIAGAQSVVPNINHHNFASSHK